MLKIKIIKKISFLILLIFSSSYVSAQTEPTAESCLEMYETGWLFISSHDYYAGCYEILEYLPVLGENPTPEDIIVHQIATDLINEDYDNCLVIAEAQFMIDLDMLNVAYDECLAQT